MVRPAGGLVPLALSHDAPLHLGVPFAQLSHMVGPVEFPWAVFGLPLTRAQVEEDF